MNLVKCDNEHFYDSDKFDSCPHCENLKANVKTSDLLGRNQKKVETVIPDEACLKNYQKIGHRKVTGWLVCIEGEMKGDSFSLFEGLNHIGRAANMDVALFKEPTVSRENHALLVYQKDTNSFTLTAGADVESPILHNNNQIKKEDTCLLSAHDILTLGECKLCFIPFCDESFSWTD